MNATTKKKAAPKKKAQAMVAGNKEFVTAESVQALPATQTEQVMNSLMASIASGDLAPEQLKMVLDAQERILDKQAKQDYSIAMQAVQAKMPSIKKNKENTQTNSRYADLDAIIKTITPIYTLEGFSLSFDTTDSPLELHIRVVCDVMHVGGWSKRKQVDVPLDLMGIKGAVNKTKVHGTGSAFSYGRRYLTAMIFNLTTNDDDDGVAAGAVVVYLISETQLADMRSLIEEVGSTEEGFAAHCRLDALENMPLAKYKSAIDALKAKGMQS